MANKKITEYGCRRLENIKRNNEMLAALKIQYKIIDFSTFTNPQRSFSTSMSCFYIHVYLRGISKLFNSLLVGRIPIKTIQMYIFVCFRVNLFPTSSLGWPESSCNSSIFYFYFILWSCFKKLIGLESMYICNILIHITGFMSTFHFNYN